MAKWPNYDWRSVSSLAIRDAVFADVPEDLNVATARALVEARMKPFEGRVVTFMTETLRSCPNAVFKVFWDPDTLSIHFQAYAPEEITVDWIKTEETAPGAPAVELSVSEHHGIDLSDFLPRLAKSPLRD